MTQTVREIITQLAGSASVCWDKQATSRGSENVFNSTQAMKFVEEALLALHTMIMEKKKRKCSGHNEVCPCLTCEKDIYNKAIEDCASLFGKDK
jgi:deoxycytidylate deaminase